MKRLTKVRIAASSLLSLSLAICCQLRSEPHASQNKQLDNNKTEMVLVAMMEHSTTSVGGPVVAFFPPPSDVKKPSPGTIANQKITHIYVIKVVDGKSKEPVAKANVTVELVNTARTKWGGHTDAKGAFTFMWEPNTRSTKAHISIQAPGFWSVDDDNVLADERIFQLKRDD